MFYKFLPKTPIWLAVSIAAVVIIGGGAAAYFLSSQSATKQDTGKPATESAQEPESKNSSNPDEVKKPSDTEPKPSAATPKVSAPSQNKASSTPSPGGSSTPTTNPSSPPPPAGTWPPTAASVGVPAGTVLTAYTGSCTITTDNLVIDSKTVNCPSGLEMGLVNGRSVYGVVIRNSVINGGVATNGSVIDTDTVAGNDVNHPEIYRIESSRVLCPTNSNCRAVGLAHFSVYNSYLQGSHSGMFAFNKVVIENSYVTTDGTSTHQSGMRMLKNSTLRGNTVYCNPSTTDHDGGCSADAVFYREFGVPGNLTIDRNYFKRVEPYGQWYATRFIDCQDTDDCLNIKFINNMFDLGQGTAAGEFPNDAGNVWSGNYWVDGVPAGPDDSR